MIEVSGNTYIEKEISAAKSNTARGGPEVRWGRQKTRISTSTEDSLPVIFQLVLSTMGEWPSDLSHPWIRY